MPWNNLHDVCLNGMPYVNMQKSFILPVLFVFLFAACDEKPAAVTEIPEPRPVPFMDQCSSSKRARTQ